MGGDIVHVRLSGFIYHNVRMSNHDPTLQLKEGGRARHQRIAAQYNHLDRNIIQINNYKNFKNKPLFKKIISL